ncbi:MAG: radical SAM family heme chaperone HemW [Bacilli bacterium]|nr:radical SAM family heme chaperone HemW [Bacilli bacterium]
MVKSAYIHIPFCKHICSYCDFCKFIYNKDWVLKYLDSLKNEIDLDYKNEELETTYIGGGTPSSLSCDELEKLLEICSIFKLKPGYEYTIEFNIEDITSQKLELCKKYNVNRISIGVQSFNKSYLSLLERNVKVNIEEKILLTKKYFDNINIDLIYALPNQSLSDLKEDLDKYLKLDIPHISCYSLIIEEHTKLNNMHFKPIDEDLDYDMYQLINNKLTGYNHYEISNYAKPGYESKHNLTYWNNEEYYGFGCGASSYIENYRYNNSKNIINYLNKIYNKESEKIDLDEKIRLELILGFRKIKGINISDFKKKYNKDILELFNIKDLVKEEKLIINDDYIFINEKYLYISNEILINFV